MDLLTQVLIISLLFFVSVLLWLLRRPSKELPVASPLLSDVPQPILAKEKKSGKTKLHAPTHALYAGAVKGFLAHVVDFDIKERVLAVCCEDGRIRLYGTEGLMDAENKYIQTKVEGEPSAIAVNPNGDAIVWANTVDKRISLLSVQSKSGSKSLTLVSKFEAKHFHTVKSLAMSASFIISCAEEGDTEVIFWSYEGEIIQKYDTNQIKNRSMTVSANFKLMSIAAWLSDARVVEIQYEKNTSTFKSAKAVMSLKGHTQGLLSVGFDETGSYAITSSKDGTVRVWKTDVRYEVSEDPKLILSLPLPSDTPTADIVAIGTQTFALASRNNIEIREKLTGKVLDSIPDAHPGEITKMRYFHLHSSEFLLTSAVDAKLHIWKLPQIA